jgi:ATP-dependent DNA ligase
MTSSPSATERRAWRPQSFGTQRSQRIRDPLVEPMWEGDRVLIHIVADGVTIVDIEGGEVDLVPEIAEATVEALAAESAVLDGYLTPQPLSPGTGLVGEISVPTATEMTTQMLLGRARTRKRELADAKPAAIAPGDPLALVVVDLLSLDDEPLLDVPLLERKRLLEGAVRPSHLVRLGAYVRPPIDAWIGSWRSQGFRAIAFKEANGRYRPGERADDWAVANIPTR